MESGRSVQEIIDHFTDKQIEATNAVFDADFVLYGGARGGGKSYWLRWMNVVLLLYWYHSMGLKNVRVGLFCESYPTLKDRQIGKIIVEFPLWLGELKDTQGEGLGFYLNEANGSGAIMLRNLDDPDKYKSAEFAAVGVDQLELNRLDTFNLVRGSKRWTGIPHTKFIASANPGGIGHGYIKQYWLDKDFPSEMRDIAEQFRFIQALPKDNPNLSQAYLDELNSLPEDLRRAWVEGDWDIFEGQAFRVFRGEKHVIQPFEVPASWPRWRGVDWGYAKPFCCLWLTKDPDTGRVYVYRELYEVELTDRQQAKRILEWTQPGEAIQVTYADPSMWARKNVEDRVTSTADEYREEGIQLTRGDNDRLSGKRKVDRLLNDLPDGKPGLQIFDNCVNLRRTLPALPYSKVVAEDVDSNAEDHCLVAGTMVTTNKGDKPIEEVEVGNRVLTRNGYHKVTRSWLTKRGAEVYHVAFDGGRGFTSTGKHPVYVVGKGFIPVDTLRYGDIIITKESVLWSRSLSIKEYVLGAIQKASIELTDFITHLHNVIEGVELSHCTARYGKTRMEKSLLGIISTIKMGIHSTTPLRISNAYRCIPIFQTMQGNTPLVQNTWHASDYLLLNGIGLKRVRSGIDCLAKRHGLVASIRKLPVPIVVKCSTQKYQGQEIDSAQKSVCQHIDVGAAWTMPKEHALSAVRNIQQTNTLTNELAPDCVVRVYRVWKLDSPQDVYNLEVKNKHEFFANGVLVHNCYDALKYALTREKGREKQKVNRKPDVNPLYDLIGR